MADRVFGAEAAGGIGQNRVLLQVQVVENAAALLIDQAFAADCHRGHFAAGRRQAVLHQLERSIFAGAGDEPALELKRADDQWRLGGRGRIAGAAAHERDDLDGVVIAQQLIGVTGQRNHFAVDFHRNAPAIEAQAIQHLSDGNAFGKRLTFAIHRDIRHDCYGSDDFRERKRLESAQLQAGAVANRSLGR